MFIRYLVSSAVATAITFGLFFLMQALIEITEVKLADDNGGRVIDFVRLKRQSTTENKKRKLPDKVKPQVQPKISPMNLPNLGASSGDAVALAAPELDGAVDVKGSLNLGAAPSDTEAVPVVRVEPVYPHNAAMRHIEGWVLLQFTIGATGAVKDAKVLDSDPPRIFDSAAVRAISKWKYNAKIIDGKAQVTRGVKVRLTFKLD